MVRLRVVSGKRAGVQCTARRFPFTIGRAPDSHLRLDDDGVWERHASLAFDPAEGWVLRAESDALLSVNGQPVRRARLRNGDHFHIGGAVLQFWLAPLTPSGGLWREALVWGVVTTVTVAQLVLMFWLPR